MYSLQYPPNNQPCYNNRWFLQSQGYSNIQVYGGEFVYDISASKDDKKFVFQVTVYIITSKVRAQKFANHMGLNHKCLFIAPKDNRYIIKDFPKGGRIQLSERGINNAISFDMANQIRLPAIPNLG
jgi:hypothetical protein